MAANLAAGTYRTRVCITIVSHVGVAGGAPLVVAARGGPYTVGSTSPAAPCSPCTIYIRILRDCLACAMAGARRAGSTCR